MAATQKINFLTTVWGGQSTDVAESFGFPMDLPLDLQR